MRRLRLLSKPAEGSNATSTGGPPPNTGPSQDSDDGKDLPRWDKAIAALVTAYTMITFLVSLTTLVAIWPTTTSQLSLNSTRTITIPYAISGVKVTLGPETLVVLTMMLAGIVGACLFSFYAVSLHLAYKKDFDHTWLSWYLLRPPMGGGLAFIAYVVIRAGIFSVGSGLQDVNFLGLAGICFLVGLFTEHFMVRLHSIADSVFGKLPDEKGKSSKKPSSPGST